jgi:hypothetical protein
MAAALRGCSIILFTLVAQWGSETMRKINPNLFVLFSVLVAFCNSGQCLSGQTSMLCLIQQRISNTDVYKCTSSGCTAYSSLIDSDYGNPHRYTLTGTGTQYFAEFDYSDEC